jgi:hypothetical protein
MQRALEGGNACMCNLASVLISIEVGGHRI